MTKADRKSKLAKAGWNDRDYADLLAAAAGGALAMWAGAGVATAGPREAATTAAAYADAVVGALDAAPPESHAARVAKLQRAGLTARDFAALVGGALGGYLAALAGAVPRLDAHEFANTAGYVLSHADAAVATLVAHENRADEQAAADRVAAERAKAAGASA